MLMTEEEAKTKWCPSAREGSGEFPFNRFSGDMPPDCTCLGSACMAWRWGTFVNGGAVPPELACDQFGRAYKDGDPVGYCGAFGKPEV